MENFPWKSVEFHGIPWRFFTREDGVPVCMSWFFVPPMEPAFWSAVARYHSPQVPPLIPVSRSQLQEVVDWIISS